jgi:uncharacterized protein (TIGR01777 family)
MAERKMGIVGATGFIGGKLAERAVRDGWTVCGFSRSGSGKSPVIREWRPWTSTPDLSGFEAIVNLSGHPIDSRWNEKNRRLFRESRVGTTQILGEAFRALPAEKRPAVLVNGSAVGIYGDRGDEILDDSSSPGKGYLAGLCQEWEAAAHPAEDLGIRVAQIRTGVVLGRGGAAFEKMSQLFKLGLGGRLGSGGQWMPWIHVQDLADGILHIVGHPRLFGPVNGSAPEPVRNEEFTRQLARALRRPAFLHVPPFALKVILGGFASAVLEGQRAIPRALLESGYQFSFPELPAALHDLILEG